MVKAVSGCTIGRGLLALLSCHDPDADVVNASNRTECTDKSNCMAGRCSRFRTGYLPQYGIKINWITRPGIKA